MKNLATAVQVSIDTAVQHCEVKLVVGVGSWDITNVHHVPRSSWWTARRWYSSCGKLVLTWDADGCNGQTCLAWLREHSQGEVGLHVVFVGMSSSLLCALGSASGSGGFVGFEVLMLLKNQLGDGGEAQWGGRRRAGGSSAVADSKNMLVLHT